MVPENMNPDSYKAALQNCSVDEQAGLMLLIASSLFKTNTEEALEFACRAEICAKANKQLYELALARKIVGNVHFVRNENEKAQKRYFSALKPALKTDDDKLLGDLYYNLGRTFTRLNDYQPALMHLQKSAKIRKQLQDREDECASLNHIGQVYWELNDYTNAEAYFQKSADSLGPEDKTILASKVYNNMGNALLKNGKTDKALDAYLVSLKIKETLGDDTSLVSAYVNLGILYMSCGDFRKSVDFYLKAFRIYEKKGDHVMIAVADSNLGAAYNELGDLKSAFHHHRKALKVFVNEGMSEETAKTLNNIGNAYLKQKNYSQALKYFEKAQVIKLKLDDAESLAIGYKNIGSVYCLTNNLQSAVDNFKLSIDYSLRTNNKKVLMENYSRLSEVYAAMGDFENAYETLSRYSETDFENFSAESYNKLMETMVRFDVEQKTNEITQLTELQKVQKEMLDQQIKDKLKYMNLYRSKQIEVKKREQTQKALEDLNKDLEIRIVKALDEYRNQQELIIQKSKLESLGVLAAGIAHEIYQPLSAISISISNIRNKAQKSELNGGYLDTKFSKITEDIQRIRQVIEHVRMFSRNQKDSPLQQVDVNETLKEAVNLIAHDLNKNNISIELKLSEVPLITVGSKYKLEQVFLNLLSNAGDAILQKSESRKSGSLERLIGVKTSSADNMAEIEFFDNGIGMTESTIEKMFDPFFTTKNPEKGTGLGLSISYGIISDMDGKIHVQSIPKEFTKITVRLPKL